MKMTFIIVLSFILGIVVSMLGYNVVDHPVKFFAFCIPGNILIGILAELIFL